MKVLLALLKGFETMEASVFIDIFGWARNDFGADVEVETFGFDRKVTSTFGVPVLVDEIIDGVMVEDYDALAIPGGFEEFGYYEEAYSEAFSKLVQQFHKQGKPIATICVAALALGKSGILKGRRATTYHLGDGRRQQQLREFGALVVEESIVADENIITSYCPQTGPGVALELLKRLTSEEMMLAVQKAMGFEAVLFD